MSKTTRIANRDVPIHEGEVVTVVFSGGPNPGDAGAWDFWVISNKKNGLSARWHHDQDPGGRFRLMGGAKGYEKHWEVARTAIGIRPATREEIIAWLKDHPEDAPFAETAEVGGRTLRVVRTNDSFRFEPL